MATSNTWTRTLDSDPGPWTRILDPGLGPWTQTWTLDPDPEKPGYGKMIRRPHIITY